MIINKLGLNSSQAVVKLAALIVLPTLIGLGGCSEEKSADMQSDLTDAVSEQVNDVADKAAQATETVIEETKEAVAEGVEAVKESTNDVVATVEETPAPVAMAEPEKEESSKEDNAGIPDRFRVCADPYSLPGSNKELKGYENKIAQLFAEKMGVTAEFEWFPQRIGFIRNTLRNDDTEDGRHKCDIVMGVTEGFELAATSKPYFRSAWSMVYVKGRGLDYIESQEDLKNLSDEKKKALKIGIFDKSPATEWVFHEDLMDQAFPYQIMMGDARAYPGQIIENDLADDEINLTFVWGPIAGYFAKQVGEEKGLDIKVIPMKNEHGIKFDYRITMAVRYGEKAWKEKINTMIDENQDEINAILKEYGVPLLEM